MKQISKKVSVIVLLVLYFVGALGIGFNLLPGLEALTSIHLFITFLFLIYWHEKKSIEFWVWLVLAYVVGSAVEFLGVHYGFLFGSYEYGDSMAPLVQGTPVIIGINWIILSYCFTRFSDRLTPEGWSCFAKAGVAATLMTAFDVIIEPVAIDLDFWSWSGDQVPWTNYSGWWLVSLAINYLFLRLGVEEGKNPVALWVLGLQLFFFIFVYVFRL